MENRLYEFRTSWIIDAPIEAVWEAIVRSERWTEWWPHVESVEEISQGNPDGIGSVLRFTWRGALPYSLTFQLVVTVKDRPRLLEGVTSGDLEGTGRWSLMDRDDLSTLVQYDWNVRTKKPWMNILAPVAGWIFRWNHDRVMSSGRRGLNGYLGGRLSVIFCLIGNFICSSFFRPTV